MKAVLVIYMPDNLDIPLEDIKAEITVWSKDVRKSMLYLKYKNVELKPLPPMKNTSKLQGFGNSQIVWTDRIIHQNEGWNACLDEIMGETE